MGQIHRHGRYRENRGVLSAFNNLSNEKQNIFLLLKKEIYDYFSDKMDLYVCGSYYWGFWDEESDYDIGIIRYNFDSKKITDDFKNKLNIKMHLLRFDNEMKGILIP